MTPLRRRCRGPAPAAVPRLLRLRERGPSVVGGQYGAAMMGMGGLGPDGRRRQRLVAGLVVAAMLLTVGAVLIGSVL